MNLSNLPRILAVLARVMLSGLALVGVASALFLAAGRLGGVPILESSLVLMALASAAAAAVYLALRGTDVAVRKVAWELVALFVSLVVVETMIAVWAPSIPSPQLTRKRTADKLGIPFDIRTKSEVVQDLAVKGIDALPGISREWPQMAAVRQQLPEGLFPLSGASRATVVECNETGQYLELVTDELGFRNPPGLLASRHVDVAAVGASFTLGHCLPTEQTLVGVIRSTFPRTVSLAMAGGGALSMLGTFREYVEPLRPRVVLWVMHPNTVPSTQDMQDPILKRYLEPGFSQHLVERQPAVDAAWRSLAITTQHEFDWRSKANVQAAEESRFKRIPFLPQLRERLHLVPGALAEGSNPDLGPFLQAVKLAKHTTETWGGRFVVVIMPLYQDVVAGQLPPVLRHAALAETLTKAGFDVVDGGDVFARQPDPRGLYTMRINNHPNRTGYALLGHTVIATLERYFPETVARVQR